MQTHTQNRISLFENRRIFNGLDTPKAPNAQEIQNDVIKEHKSRLNSLKKELAPIPPKEEAPKYFKDTNGDGEISMKEADAQANNIPNPEGLLPTVDRMVKNETMIPPYDTIFAPVDEKFAPNLKAPIATPVATPTPPTQANPKYNTEDFFDELGR